MGISFNECRSNYYNLPIGAERVWVKKIRGILESDIHEKPLGCKIANTHVKIENVHLESFYEAQILFSHAYWVDLFATELCSMIISNNLKSNKEMVLIGYETYLEPLLFSLCNKLRDSKFKVTYCIYEEKKFTYNQQTKSPEIRYIENSFTPIEVEKESMKYRYKDKVLIFLCGIASTLGTFFKMKDLFLENFEVNDSQKFKKIQCYSIIQVLPQKQDTFFVFDKVGTLSWCRKDKVVTREYKGETLPVSYIVDVFCKWHNAKECPLCYPTTVDQEKPIIATSETSLVPMQMITLNNQNIGSSKIKNNSLSNLDFFESKLEGGIRHFIYQDYLYYGHIIRDNHHSLYYIRTNHLLSDIINSKLCGQKKNFDEYCDVLKDSIDFNAVNIIVSPSHFSSKTFCSVINEKVFAGEAHIISFDPKKEYRSNFRTKYSNYSYFLEQTKDAGKDIKFYYVDDQIITGSTFHRVKSLIRDLRNFKASEGVFEGVFVLVSRISQSTIKNYIDSEHYYTFFTINVPSIRSYADSCPLCKLRAEADEYGKNSVLDINAYHWVSKKYHYRLRSLKEAKDELNKNSGNFDYGRYFRRFYCENEIYERIHKEGVCFDSITKVINDLLKSNKKQHCEYLISCLKVLSRPFIYYRESIKPIVLKILIGLLEKLISINKPDVELCEGIDLTLYNIEIHFNNNYEVYSLLVVLINCLASIDSNYLLFVDENKGYKVSKIEEIYNFVKNLNLTEKILGFPEIGEVCVPDSLYSVILNAVKRIILGISGRDKSERIDKIFEEIYDGNSSVFTKRLVMVLYLENSVDQKTLMRNGDDCKIDDDEIIDEYTSYANQLKELIRKSFDINTKRLGFYYFDSNLSNYDEFNLFSIDDAVRLSVLELFDSTTKISDICYNLSALGFYYKQNKFLIKLHRYTENEIRQKKQIESEVYLFVDFGTKGECDIDIKKQLFCIRLILQHRAFLTGIIKRDLDSRTIKVAIQARAAERLIESDKLSGHGRSNDINELLLLAYRELAEGGEEEKGYKLLNIFMNRCIAFGGAREILLEFFEHEKDGPFSIVVENRGKEGQTIFKNYLRYLLNQNNTTKHFKLDDRKINLTIDFKNEKDGVTFIANDFSSEEFEKWDGVCFDLYPKLLHEFPTLNGDENNTIYQTILVGMVDVFIRNIVTHTDSAEINVIINIDRDDRKITIVNDIEKKDKQQSLKNLALFKQVQTMLMQSHVKTKSTTSAMGMTELFFVKYLGRRLTKNDIKNVFCVDMKPDETDNCFKATICVKIEEE